MGGDVVKFVVALDSFKGSLSSKDGCLAVQRGIHSVLPDAEVVTIPFADGGEGTLDSLVAARSGEIRVCKVRGPLGAPVMARYGILAEDIRPSSCQDGAVRSSSCRDDSCAGGAQHATRRNGADPPDTRRKEMTAVIEMAEASGLTLVAEGMRNPMTATTYGTGELILHGLDAGCRRFIVCIGGSATNDGGAGMAQALGFELLDQGGRPVCTGGGGLGALNRIDARGADPRLAGCEFVVACDVNNPLCGSEGASAVFGPQKGATADMVARLDDHLRNFAAIIRRDLGKDILNIPGAGAAGGLGGGLMAFLNARLVSGVHLVMDTTGFQAHLKNADYVVTGEGRYDSQTAGGKAPAGIALAARAAGVPAVLIAGSVMASEGAAIVPETAGRPPNFSVAGSSSLAENATGSDSSAGRAAGSAFPKQDPPLFSFIFSLAGDSADTAYTIAHAAECVEKAAAEFARILKARGS
jgi:glycerate kinase